MARTKSSRGKEPFKMKSPETPYPFLGKIVGGAVGAVKNLFPGGKGNKAAEGARMAGSADDVNTKIDEIHQALVGEEESTMMTKKVASPLYHGDHQDPQVGKSTKKAEKESRHRHVYSNVNQGRPKD